MKSLKIIFIIVIFFCLKYSNAQTPPNGFVKGSIILADGSSISGFVKDNMRKSASVTFITNPGEKKKEYSGASINGVEINNTSYTCIIGDFFKKICDGETSLLQKVSNASGKIIYNGTEPTVLTGTNGKPGDYLIYNSANRQLTVVDSNNIKTVMAEKFAACKHSLDK